MSKFYCYYGFLLINELSVEKICLTLFKKAQMVRKIINKWLAIKNS